MKTLKILIIILICLPSQWAMAQHTNQYTAMDFLGERLNANLGPLCIEQKCEDHVQACAEVDECQAALTCMNLMGDYPPNTDPVAYKQALGLCALVHKAQNDALEEVCGDGRCYNSKWSNGLKEPETCPQDCPDGVVPTKIHKKKLLERVSMCAIGSGCFPAPCRVQNSTDPTQDPPLAENADDAEIEEALYKRGIWELAWLQRKKTPVFTLDFSFTTAQRESDGTRCNVWVKFRNRRKVLTSARSIFDGMAFAGEEQQYNYTFIGSEIGVHNTEHIKQLELGVDCDGIIRWDNLAFVPVEDDPLGLSHVSLSVNGRPVFETEQGFYAPIHHNQQITFDRKEALQLHKTTVRRGLTHLPEELKLRNFFKPILDKQLRRQGLLWTDENFRIRDASAYIHDIDPHNDIPDGTLVLADPGHVGFSLFIDLSGSDQVYDQDIDFDINLRIGMDITCQSGELTIEPTFTLIGYEAVVEGGLILAGNIIDFLALDGDPVEDWLKGVVRKTARDMVDDMNNKTRPFNFPMLGANAPPFELPLRVQKALCPSFNVDEEQEILNMEWDDLTAHAIQKVRTNQDPGHIACNICGDGIINEYLLYTPLRAAWERCDNGDDNSNHAPNACREDCTLPRCGDGVVDDGEECDDGDWDWETQEGNHNQKPNHCRTNCRQSVCGDGMTDDGEVCDDGDDNGRFFFMCTDDCRSKCGDGQVTGDEVCDDGAPDDGQGNGLVPGGCAEECDGFVPLCGNGIVEDGELCDGQAGVDAGICAADCKSVCGNNVIEAGEICDFGALANGSGEQQIIQGLPMTCNATCTARCGDGLQQAGEVCDHAQLNGQPLVPSNAICHVGCQVLELCGNGVVEGNEVCDSGANNGLEGACNETCDALAEAGTCAGKCGGQSQTGCYCDAVCVKYGDCCNDYQQVCNETNGATCGDGVVEHSETCDDGSMNGVHGYCNADCTSQAVCGNGLLEEGEFCDDGSSNGVPGKCNAECNALVPAGPSCAGSCGGKAPDGCWCDELCAQFGDCCPDVNDVCDND